MVVRVLEWLVGKMWYFLLTRKLTGVLVCQQEQQ
jgi:hypothetical protein